MNNATSEGTVYLTVREGRYYRQLTVDKATTKKPRVTPEGSVIVKLKIRIPVRAFMPLEPSVVIDVPEDALVSGDNVTVEAVPDD
jgi:hypothetical protein